MSERVAKIIEKKLLVATSSSASAESRLSAKKSLKSMIRAIPKHLNPFILIFF